MSGRRYPPAKWALPETVFFNGTKCYGMRVPDEPGYLAAWRGAIFGLTRAYNWADDPAHTAKDVAMLWMDFVDEAQEIPCASLGTPPFFMHINEDDSDLTSTLLYDISDERDLTFAVRIWAAYANPPDAFSPAHMSFDFVRYEDAEKVGVRIVNMFIRQGPAGSLVPMVLHWWDCSDTGHEETTSAEQILKIDWPPATQIGVTRFYIEAHNPLTVFVTAKIQQECLAP